MEVGPLGQEEPLEKETATHSGVLPGIIPGTEEPGGLQSMGVTKSDWDTEHTHGNLFISRTNAVVLNIIRELQLNHWNVIGREKEWLILQNNTSIFYSCSIMCMKVPSEKNVYTGCICAWFDNSKLHFNQPFLNRKKKKKSEACNCATCKSLLDWSPSLWFGNDATNTSLFSSLEKKTNREKSTMKRKVMINPSGTKRVVFRISGSTSPFQINSSNHGMTTSPPEE